ncbi:MAG: RNA 2',3'-cyclic phosphodiesterase [Ilumatobacteraceae bacterium]
MPGRPARLFVAVWPPADVVEQLAALPRLERPGVRWVPRANWHVTLRFIGDAVPEAVRSRLDGVRLPGATAQLGPQVDHLGADAVVVPVEGLGELAGAVVAATPDVGRSPDGRPFRGHVTMARLRRARSELVGHPLTGSFDVTEVVLARSTLTSAGARYDHIASWPVFAVP